MKIRTTRGKKKFTRNYIEVTKMEKKKMQIKNWLEGNTQTITYMFVKQKKNNEKNLVL